MFLPEAERNPARKGPDGAPVGPQEQAEQQVEEEEQDISHCNQNILRHLPQYKFRYG
jgi:hypothetical protein